MEKKYEELLTVARIKERTKEMLEELKKRGSMSVVEAALLSGYSLTYFRAYIANVLKLLYGDCLAVSRGELHWLCQE
ncbi:MAG: hypothetical protein QXT64_01830 [Desulfurococcaceae archaeon]